MNSFIILAADIGTSSLKAAFIDISGAASRRCAASVRVPYTGLCENRAAGWEAAFYTAVKALFRQKPEALVQAIAISGNGPTLVAISGKKCNENVLKVMNWFDSTEKIEKVEGISSFFLPHIAVFKKNSPGLYQKTSFFVSCEEWLSHRLGAEIFTALPNPAYIPFFWDGDQCAALDIDRKKLPPLKPLGSITGALSKESARLTGIAAGTPIAACGPDFIMSLLGTAAIHPGLVCDRAGTSEGINICARDKPVLTASSAAQTGENYPIRVLPHAIEGFWNVSIVLPESGSIFEKYRADNNLQNQSYEETLKEKSAMPVLQEIAGQVRRAIDTLTQAGFPVTEMRLSGGQAKCPAWNKLKAELTGCPLLVPEIIDAELSGNAAAVMLALNQAPTLTAACDSIVIITDTISKN